MRMHVATLAVFLGLFPLTASHAAGCLNGTLTAIEQDQQLPKGARVVVLNVVIEPDGSVSNATIEKSSGVVAFDWAALDQARTMHLAPGEVDGEPVRSQKKIALGIKPPSQEPPQQDPSDSDDDTPRHHIDV